MYGIGCRDIYSADDRGGLGCGLEGVGDFLDTATTISQFDPTGFSQVGTGVANFFRTAIRLFGKGRREADLLAPVQNSIGDRLKVINDAINTSTIQQLQRYWAEVSEIGRQYQEFAMSDEFTADGDYRASTGALNTILPLIDGTDAAGNQVRADRGTLGTIERRIRLLGGTLLPPQITQSYGSAIVPTLQFSQQNFPFTPQAGIIPPNAPLSPIRATGFSLSGSGLTDLLPYAIAAGLAITLLNRR